MAQKFEFTIGMTSRVDREILDELKSFAMRLKVDPWKLEEMYKSLDNSEDGSSIFPVKDPYAILSEIF